MKKNTLYDVLLLTTNSSIKGIPVTPLNYILDDY